MQNTTIPQFQQTGLSQPIFQRTSAQTHGDVVQDKSASHSERSRTSQPERFVIEERADVPDTKTKRTQKQHVHSDAFVRMTIHVPYSWKDEIQRRAANASTKEQRVSMSEVGRPIFQKGLQSDIDLQYGAMLEPVIRRIISHET